MRLLLISILALFSCGIASSQPAAKDQPSAKELIAKFRKAIGADAIVPTPFVIKYRGQRYYYSVVDGKLQGEVFDFGGTLMGYTHIPQKLRKETEMKIGIVPFRHVETVDGKSGWYQDNDSEPVVMSKELLEGKRQRELHISIFLGRESFDPEHWQFSEPKSTRVRGQEAWEFTAKTSGLEPITLFFAKKSGLLLHLKTQATDFSLLAGSVTKLESYTRDFYFSDWKKVGNHMLPGNFEAFHDGVLKIQMEPVRVSFPKTLDSKLFALPKTKK
jgi:hypothetical protein